MAGDCPPNILVRNAGFTAEYRDQRFIDIAAVDPVTSVHKKVADEFAGFHINLSWLPVALFFPVNQLSERRTGFVDRHVQQADP